MAALALLAACAGARVPLVLPGAGDEAAGARRVAERARGAEVVYLGELHDNPRHHAVQARVLEAMLETGARPAVGFEMLVEEQQAAVDELLGTDTPSAREGDTRLRWTARGWPDFSMYWPLFELARRYRLPVVAADLDAALVRRVARDGLASLGETRGRLVSRLPVDPDRERVIARTIQTAHCNLLPERRLPTMVESWHARNVTMARRLAAALSRVGQVVVIIGRGHQETGGLPAQLEALRPGTRQLVVELREAPAGGDPDPARGAEVAVRRGSADIVWVTAGPTRPDPCEGLRQRLGRRPMLTERPRE